MTILLVLLEGRFTDIPEGVMNDEVSIKKINNRNTMSVSEDILNVESTLCLDFKFIF